jgi:hypothetical protein
VPAAHAGGSCQLCLPGTLVSLVIIIKTSRDTKKQGFLTLGDLNVGIMNFGCFGFGCVGAVKKLPKNKYEPCPKNYP